MLDKNGPKKERWNKHSKWGRLMISWKNIQKELVLVSRHLFFSFFLALFFLLRMFMSDHS